MSEYFEGGDFCKECKQPQYTGHSTDCPRNNAQSDKSDTRISMKDAQYRAEIIRDKAIENKAKDVVRDYEKSYDGQGKDFYQRDRDLFEKFSEEKQKIQQGTAEQPTKKQYDEADRAYEANEKKWEEKIKADKANAKEGGPIRHKKESHIDSSGDMLILAKNRALQYVEQGDLKGAIDSMVSDMNKDKSRPEMQKSMIVMMGMGLRNESNLTKEKVTEFIKGFN